MKGSNIHRGSCYCQKVKYEADVDLSKGTFKCNCTICFKTREWGVPFPLSNFKIIEGESELTEFVGKSQLDCKFYFCKHCGTRLYAAGKIGENLTCFLSVNTLDDVDRKQFAELEVKYYDGLNDNWNAPPDITSYL